MSFRIDDVVAAYVAARNEKAAIEQEFEARLAPVKEKLEVLGAWLLGNLNSTGMESVRTGSGTVYKSTTARVRAEDWGAFMSWVDEMGLTPEEALGFVERRPSKEAVTAYVTEHGAAPSGLAVEYVTKVNVRKS